MVIDYTHVKTASRAQIQPAALDLSVLQKRATQLPLPHPQQPKHPLLQLHQLPATAQARPGAAEGVLLRYHQATAAARLQDRQGVPRVPRETKGQGQRADGRDKGEDTNIRGGVVRVPEADRDHLRDLHVEVKAGRGE